MNGPFVSSRLAGEGAEACTLMYQYHAEFHVKQASKRASKQASVYLFIFLLFFGVQRGGGVVMDR
jgi:hypothetical protein